MMRTAVAETSLIAYHGIRRDGTLSKQQAAIMAVIRYKRDYSLQEIARETGMPINVVSGRVNELKADRWLVEALVKRKCSITGRLIQPVKLPENQMELFA